MSAMSTYKSLIEAVGAEIFLKCLSGDEFASEEEYLFIEAKARFGKVKLLYIEFWHDGGCSAAGVPNHTIYKALKSAGWEGERIGKDHDGEIYMVQDGAVTGKKFSIQRPDSSQPKFNLRAEPVFLPASTDDEAFESGKVYLVKVLEDMISARAEASKAISVALLKAARNDNI